MMSFKPALLTIKLISPEILLVVLIDKLHFITVLFICISLIVLVSLPGCKMYQDNQCRHR